MNTQNIEPLAFPAWEFPKGKIINSNLIIYGVKDRKKACWGSPLRQLGAYNRLKNTVFKKSTKVKSIDSRRVEIYTFERNRKKYTVLKCRTAFILPDGLLIRGDLDLSLSLIQELPRGLVVNGNLFISNTCVSVIPDDIKVGGSFIADRTLITELPKRATFGDSIILNRSKLRTLPDNLTVYGRLDVSGTPITDLPSCLRVNDALSLRCTKVRSLPWSFSVGGSIDLTNTSIESIRPRTVFSGNLKLSNTKKLHSIGENVTIKGTLDLTGSALPTLPNNLNIGGNLHLVQTLITAWPENLMVGGSVYSSNALPVPLPASAGIGRRIPRPRKDGFEADRFNRRAKPPFLGDGSYIQIFGNLYKILNRGIEGFQVLPAGNPVKGYLVTDGNGVWGYGYTLAKAQTQLAFKLKARANRYYCSMPYNERISLSTAIEMYFSITGCFLCCDRLKETILDSNSLYTLQQIIEISRGFPGSREFETFFNKRHLYEYSKH